MKFSNKSKRKDKDQNGFFAAQTAVKKHESKRNKKRKEK